MTNRHAAWRRYQRDENMILFSFQVDAHAAWRLQKG
jgi:hypothetical protein